jgi:opacity protein-like surface antigen
VNIMRRCRLCLCFGFILLAAVPAAAADLRMPAAVPAPVSPDSDWGRLYLSLHGGGGFLQSTSIDYVNNALPGRRMSFDGGWAVVGAVGWQVAPWWRVEIELGRQDNGVTDIIPGAGASGSVAATTLMGNVYLDIPTQARVAPYVGAGFGKAWISHHLVVDGGTLVDTTSWPFAYQLIGGAKAAIAPHWNVSLEYRFLGTQRGLFQDTQGLFYHAGYNNHSVLLGLTWRPL